MIMNDNSIDDTQNVLSPILTIFVISLVVALWLSVSHKPISPSLHLLWLMVIVSNFKEERNQPAPDLPGQMKP